MVVINESLAMAGAISGIFTGIGVCIVLLVGAYLLYQIAKLYRAMCDNEIRYFVVENIMLSKLCKKKGIELDKEMIKADFVRRNRKSIRQRLKEEIYNEFFGKDESDKESE